ncbi:nucleotidyltransferase domain-containing protein [Thomasclavelia cocleata]|uniref:nucleotidyltransferase domain-containing protein n=1 Tax=Thomasclavelia cocleata TaxID=69824 RepID=UPI00261EAF49|nr:nucleotidyltransferase domain-containing protein [Thomasclavelia cocleata]
MIKGVTAGEDDIIKSILAPYREAYKFYFYGSRVKGTHSKVSDLDILIKGATEMPLELVEDLKQQFDDSSLPYIVNFSDYHKMDENFYKLIKKDLVSVC